MSQSGTRKGRVRWDREKQDRTGEVGQEKAGWDSEVGQVKGGTGNSRIGLVRWRGRWDRKKLDGTE